MKNKKTQPSTPPKAVTPVAKEPKKERKPLVFEEIPYTQRNFWIVMGIIIAGCLVAYAPGLFNEFTWDARPYVLDNKYIEKFPAWESWQSIFTKFELGNYQPITMLSWAIECMLVGKSPWLYHLDQTLLHIANSYLVLRLIYRLSNNFLLASITALLFALHPLHVESVVWAAERKDTLYTLFILFSYIYYVRYWQEGKNQKWYWLSILMFVLSCFSKAMAVVLPIVLLLTDYFFFNRKPKNFKELFILGFEKAPYFAIALGVGILSIIAQRDAGADATSAINSQYSVLDRAFIILYNFSFYWVKMLIPYNLKAFYSYPDKPIGNEFYLGTLLTFALAFAIFRLGKKNEGVWWGGLYFFIVILPVIQLMPIGSAIVADRYFYLSSIGPLYVLALGIDYLYRSREAFRRSFYVGVGAVCVLMTFMSFQRSTIWKNDIVLFLDVLEKYPTNGFINGNVGWAYLQKNDTVNVLKYFKKANELSWHTSEMYIKMADIYFAQKQYKEAVGNFEEALKKDPNQKNLYWTLATCYYYTDEFDKAEEFAKKALQADVKNFYAHNILGLVYTKKGMYDEALKSFATSSKYNAKFYDPYVNTGHVYDLMQQYEKGITVLEKAIKMDPKQELGYKNIGVALINLGQWKKAIEYWTKADKVFPKNPSFKYNIGLQYAQHGNVPVGVQWMQQAARQGDGNAQQVLRERGFNW
ncbi:MAG: tetratricopeptide repeat protein [Spirosomataceae bacterium]